MQPELSNKISNTYQQILCTLPKDLKTTPPSSTHTDMRALGSIILALLFKQHKHKTPETHKMPEEKCQHPEAMLTCYLITQTAGPHCAFSWAVAIHSFGGKGRRAKEDSDCSLMFTLRETERGF